MSGKGQTGTQRVDGPEAAKVSQGKRKARTKPSTLKPGAGLTGSVDAKRRASLVLEVLSGLRSPLDASVVLGVGLQRYYLLEARALQGLVEALEAKPAGRQPSPEAELRRAQAECERLARELMRAQALVRAAQRTIGVSPPEAAREKATPKGKGRKRRPTVRARRAATRLRDEAQASERRAGAEGKPDTPATVQPEKARA